MSGYSYDEILDDDIATPDRPTMYIDFIECQGERCRMHYLDGCGLHCGSCNGDSYKSCVFVDLCATPSMKSTNYINCNGSKCGRYKNDEEPGRVHCEACYPDFSTSSSSES